MFYFEINYYEPFFFLFKKGTPPLLQNQTHPWENEIIVPLQVDLSINFTYHFLVGLRGVKGKRLPYHWDNRVNFLLLRDTPQAPAPCRLGTPLYSLFPQPQHVGHKISNIDPD